MPSGCHTLTEQQCTYIQLCEQQKTASEDDTTVRPLSSSNVREPIMRSSDNCIYYQLEYNFDCPAYFMNRQLHSYSTVQTPTP